jgi:spore coat polysaccharide biosynthesis predicted glycosyltransferase SpsG
MEKIIFRVDGGNVWGISMGHITRSLILTSKLARDYEITFLMKNYEDGVEYVKTHGWNVKTLNITDDSDQSLIDYCSDISPSIIIFDLPQFNYPLFTDYAKTHGVRVIVFDIKGRVKGNPDIIINDSFVPDLVHYNISNDLTKTYIGPDYFLLAPQYQSQKKAILKRNVSDIVITMGGSDPAGLTIKILSAIRKKPLIHLHFHVILGPAFGNCEYVKKMFYDIPFITVYVNPVNFLDILAAADIAITAAGRTLLECSYLGIPVIVVPSIEHEELTAIEFSKKTAALNIGLWNDDYSVKRIQDAIVLYSNNYEIRKTVSDSEKKLIDGCGLFRILEIITPQNRY